MDSWAIEQLFPVMPIHRLDEEPAVHATLADLTCDSDGKMDKFINPRVGAVAALGWELGAALRYPGSGRCTGAGPGVLAWCGMVCWLGGCMDA